MRLRSVHPGRVAGSMRPVALAGVAAALMLAAIPAVAGAQGAEQYGESPPPAAPEGSAPAPAGEGFTPAAPTETPAAPVTPAAPTAPPVEGTVSEAPVTTEQLPVTGLAAAPLAIAGLVMLVMGALGLRRFSREPEPQGQDPDDPSGTRRILGR